MEDSEPDLSRTALYARYSSSLQQASSIIDQIRECKQLVQSRNGTVVAEYSDAEQTGSNFHSRRGLQTMLAQCRRGYYTAICTEALDRLSRDQADAANIYRELRFLGVTILTREEGIIQPIHIGLKGTMNALYLEALALKTNRGKIGVVTEGRLAHPLHYGYRISNTLQGSRTIRGLREIHPDEAPIVLKMYEMRANDIPIRHIANWLNEEGIPTPAGGTIWRPSTIAQSMPRPGILRQPLYRGQIVYGIREYLVDPTTRRKITKFRPESEWTRVAVPHLRIVSEDLWHTVQEKLDAASRPRQRKAAHVRGAYALTPLLICSSCGGPVRTFALDRYTCKAGRDGRCPASRTFYMRHLEHKAARQLFDWIRRKRAWTRIHQNAGNTLAQKRITLDAEIADTRLRLRRVLEAIELAPTSPALISRLTELELSLEQQEAQAVDLLKFGLPAPAPDTRDILLQKAALLRDELSSASNPHFHTSSLHLLQLLERIELSPGVPPAKAWMRVHPNIIALLRWADEIDPTPTS